MLHLRRLLVADGRDACSAAAIAVALPLARRHGAELHLVRVSTPSPDQAPPEPAAPVPSAEGVALVHAAAPAPSIADGVLAYAAAHDVDLVVVGTHGRRGLPRVVLGSVAERVVREAPCPVLTVPAREDAPPSRLETTGTWRRLLVPLDFSERAASALRHAAALAEPAGDGADGAVVDLVHAVEPAHLPDTYGVGLLWAELVPDLVRRSEETLAHLAATVLGPARTGETRVEVAPPAQAVLEAAERLGSDLIVMTTHGRTGLRRFALGSVAERVVRQAPCPVLTLKSFGRSLLATDAPAGAPAASPRG